MLKLHIDVKMSLIAWLVCLHARFHKAVRLVSVAMFFDVSCYVTVTISGIKIMCLIIWWVVSRYHSIPSFREYFSNNFLIDISIIRAVEYHASSRGKEISLALQAIVYLQTVDSSWFRFPSSNTWRTKSVVRTRFVSIVETNDTNAIKLDGWYFKEPQVIE